jgi:hypothetical protein
VQTGIEPGGEPLPWSILALLTSERTTIDEEKAMSLRDGCILNFDEMAARPGSHYT